MKVGSATICVDKYNRLISKNSLFKKLSTEVSRECKFFTDPKEIKKAPGGCFLELCDGSSHPTPEPVRL
jgi:hypothetical protein